MAEYHRASKKVSLHMNFINNLKVELKDKNNQKQRVFYRDIFLIGLTATLFMIKIANDGQVYFYGEYLLFSIGCALILGVCFGYIIPKLFSTTLFTKWYYLSILLLTISLSFWNIPKVLHYYFLDKKEVCITSTLTYKYFSYTSGNVGRISFETKYRSDIRVQLLSLHSLSAVPKEVFDTLPEVGSTVQICGDISRAGFIYSDIKRHTR